MAQASRRVRRYTHLMSAFMACLPKAASLLAAQIRIYLFNKPLHSGDVLSPRKATLLPPSKGSLVYAERCRRPLN